MAKMHKVRLPADSKWVSVYRSSSIWENKMQLSTEFEHFASENFGHYRYQKHSKFITVLFEREEDAVWMRLMLE